MLRFFRRRSLHKDEAVNIASLAPPAICRGEYLTCENGHACAEFIRDVYQVSTIAYSDMRVIRADYPLRWHVTLPPCPICGAPVWRSFDWHMHYHVGTRWVPELPQNRT